MQTLFEVVAEDEDFLVINKPAGLVCHPTKGDEYSSLISRVRLYLGAASTPHMINRLDRETSGIVIIAKHLEAAACLRKLWESRQVEKEYLAIVHGAFPRGKITINAPLGKDSESAVAIKDTVVPNGTPAETHAYLLRHLPHESGTLSLLRVVLLTGRKHQIRIHLAHIGYPIVGDKLYGGDENLYLGFVNDSLTLEQKRRLITENHLLHAARVTLSWFGAIRTFSCAPDAAFGLLSQAHNQPG
jgi:23S rRNA pseudouridine1911/1915/1917 synthase